MIVGHSSRYKMAQRKPKAGKTRYRRTDEELIADLQKRIEDLKRALSGAQRTLAEYYESKGISVPKARKPRARRQK